MLGGFMFGMVFMATDPCFPGVDARFHAFKLGGNYHWVDNHIVRATRYAGADFSRRYFADALGRNITLGWLQYF